jgi:2'-5' RNA ligase
MYPNPGSPRVVWLGITSWEPLKEIHKKLESQLQEAEIEPEKRSFSPHLTIARVRRNADKKTVKEIGEALSKFKVDSLGKCRINHVVLYKSELTPKGPIYTPLLSSPLNKV